jgi:hypothetical protein
MKKIIMTILGLFIIISFATTASAVDGAAITFGTLTFNPSASTSITAMTTAPADTTPSYTIISGSSKAGENGIEYGIVSAYNVIYQRTTASATFAIAEAGNVATLTGDSWETKSGSTPP